MEIRRALNADAADLVRLRSLMLEQVNGGLASPQDLKVMELRLQP